MDRERKRLISLMLVAGLIWLSGGIIASLPPSDEEPIEKGLIVSTAGTFHSEKSPHRIVISDLSGQPVFSYQCEDDMSVLLSCGYSNTLNALYVFRESLSPRDKRYSLTLETPAGTIPVCSDSPLAFYSPLLVEDNGFFAVTLRDDSSILFIDLRDGTLLQHIESNTALGALRLESANGMTQIQFGKFSPLSGRYEPQCIDTRKIPEKRCRITPLIPREQEERRPTELQEPRPLPPTPVQSFSSDHKKVIGFGDSITYGYISKLPAPELGYIPRLLERLEHQLYPDARIINEGIGGSTTVQAIERIETVIQNNQAKYLLFHYGTNDVIYYSTITTDQVLSNIGFMMDKVAQYGMKAVLSTLIPRNTKINTGIHLERALTICQGIRNMATARNIPLIDFWTLFSNYPSSDGGYFSLMSDNVHPSEKGYQLMAENWLDKLLEFPPQPPSGLSTAKTAPLAATVSWNDNEELDLNHYILRFGYTPQNLSNTVSITGNSYELLFYPFYNPLYQRIFFRLEAVDNDGSVSESTALQQISSDD